MSRVGFTGKIMQLERAENVYVNLISVLIFWFKKSLSLGIMMMMIIIKFTFLLKTRLISLGVVIFRVLFN